MKRFSLLPIFLLACAACYSNNITRPPQTPWLDFDNLFYFYMSNDGFGYDIGPDCDDYRTFGFNLGFYSSLHFFLLLDSSSLTNRSTASGAPSRTDELRLLAGYSFLDLREPFFGLRIAAGPGFLFTGDLGTGFIQKTFHDTFHFSDQRPIMYNYDPAQARFIAFLSLCLEENFLRMFALEVFGAASHSLDLNLNATLGFWVAKDFMQLSCSATYRLGRYESFSGAAREVYASEDGLWLSSVFMAGPVYIERSVNVFTLVPAGFMGMRINQKTQAKNNDIRFDYSLGGVFGFVSNVEILRVHPLPFFERISAYSWLEKHEDYETFKQMFRLHIQSVGIDVSVFDPLDVTYVNPFGYIGIGFANERQVTNDQYRALILGQRNLIMMHFGLGARAKLSDLLRFGDFEYGIEFSWDLRFCYPLSESIYVNPQSTARYGIYVSEK